MDKFSLSKWMDHPSYFFFFFLSGVCALSFFFQKKEIPTVSSIQLSSFAAEAERTEYAALNRLSDQQLLNELEKSRLYWSSIPSAPFASSPQRIESIEKRNENSLPKRFRSNPVFQVLSDYVNSSAQTDFEDVGICGKNRLYQENKIAELPSLKNLLSTSAEVENKLPRACFTHAMRSWSQTNMNYSVCSAASGLPAVPGAKPCVTPSLVAITQNSFVDVNDCLNLNPKHLFPKIQSESGFQINAYSDGKGAGIGQLTHPAIQFVNEHLTEYMAEIEKKSAIKPSCARILQYRSFLSGAPAEIQNRCSLIALPENPLRNILYTAVLNRLNMDYLSGKDESNPWGGAFARFGVREKLEKLGLKNPDPVFFKEMLAFIGYNMGVETATRNFVGYLDKRIQAGLPLTANDFDFNRSAIVTDPYDGTQKTAVALARSYVMSSFISPSDSPETKNRKVKKRKELPAMWATAHTLSFPEYIVYFGNSYDGQSTKPFLVYGYPGYLNLVAAQNNSNRVAFQNSGLDPNFCSDPSFMEMKSQ